MSDSYITQIGYIVTDYRPGRSLLTFDRDLARWFWVMGHPVTTQLYRRYSRRDYPAGRRTRMPVCRHPLAPEVALVKVYGERADDPEVRRWTIDRFSPCRPSPGRQGPADIQAR